MVSPTTDNLRKIVSRLFLFSAVAMLLALTSCYYDNEEALYPVRPGTNSCDTTSPTYALTILPIMQSNCVSCHSGSSPQGNLDLSTIDNVKIGINGHHLMDHVRGANGYSPMPPQGLPSLTTCDLHQLNAWIIKQMPAK